MTERDSRTTTGRDRSAVTVALTGGIGAGKSTVARLLADRGALVVDADAIAREVVEPGQPALQEIEKAFGGAVIDADGRLDRAALADIVFGDESARLRLNAITHPRIAARSAELLASAPTDAVVVYDMPLLVEQGPEALKGWDAIIVVDAPDDIRLTRLRARGMNETDARARMARQVSREDRLSHADYVIDNAGDSDDLGRQIDRLWERLTTTGA